MWGVALMSLTPEAQRKVIDYYFQHPNAKAVVEDEDIGATRREVEEFLGDVYRFLCDLHPDVAAEPGGVHIGENATTVDMEGFYGKTPLRKIKHD